MSNVKPLLIMLSLVVILTIVVAATPAAAQEAPSEQWCLNTGSLAGTGVTEACPNTVSDHQTVNVSFYRTTPNDSNDLNVITRVDYDTRNDSTLEVTLEHTNDGVVDSKTYKITSGNDTNSFNMSHARSEGGYVDAGEYTLTVTLTNSDGTTVASRELVSGEFYLGHAETVDDPFSSTGGSMTVVPVNKNVELDEEISDVSRYNDGSDVVGQLKDPNIPPLVREETGVARTGYGQLKDFGNMKERQNPFATDATIHSVNEGGKHLITFGTATYGVPQAKEHTIVLTYSMQTELDTNKAVGIEVVNSEGEVIDNSKKLSNLDSSSNRWLEDTVKPSVDRTQREQFTQATDNILYTETKEINLTEKEEEYINENYEAYVIYRTPESGSPGGITVFKPHRTAIYSTDQIDINFDQQPEAPLVNSPIQFNVNDVPEWTATADGDGQLVWTVRTDSGTEEYTETVTQTDVETINDPTQDWTADTSVSFSNSGTKSVTLTTIGPQGEQESRTKAVDVYTEEIADTNATFEISYKVENNFNPRYNTVDIAPKTDTLKLTVRVTNNGNSRVERDIALIDTLEEQNGYENQTRDSKTVIVEPKSTTTVRLESKWKPHEYGLHTVNVIDKTAQENGEDGEVLREGTGSADTAVYVQKPATIEVKEISAPDGHLLEDNFDTTVTIENVGDLSTKHPASTGITLNGTFAGTWDGSVTVGNSESTHLAGGDARADEAGEKTRVNFTRDGLNYSPNFPQVTRAMRDNVNSPYGVGKPRPATLKFETLHGWAEPNSVRYNELTDSNDTVVNLYRMDITALEVETGNSSYYVQPSGATYGPVYASPYKYTEAHYTTFNQADPVSIPATNFSTTGDVDWSKHNSNTVETTTGIHRVTQLEEKDDATVIMFRAKVVNSGTARTGRARIKIVSDRKVHYPADWDSSHSADTRTQYGWFDQTEYSNKVVGVAGVEMGAWDKKYVTVPVIIPNHPKNTGEHTLTVKKRGSPDYIEQMDSSWQTPYRVNVDVEGYGDSIYVGYEPNTPSGTVDEKIDETCNGLGLGDCSSGTTQPNITMLYRNEGGADVTQTINSHYFHTGTLRNSDLADHHVNAVAALNQSNNLMFDQSGDWNKAREQTINPNNYQQWTLVHEFAEPGIYQVNPTQRRIISTGGPTHMEHTGLSSTYSLAPQDQQLDYDIRSYQLRVWDVTKPSPRHHIQDCTDGSGTSKTGVSYNQCLHQEYNGLSSINSNGNVWEGGAVQIDGKQRTQWTPSEARDYRVSSDNVGISAYSWVVAGGTPNRDDGTDGKAIHRFDTSGTYDATLTVDDHSEYVENGTNTDSKTNQIEVVPDNQNPDVNVTVDSVNENYAVDGYVWAGSPVDRNGMFTDVDWDATVSDSQVGIEKGEWSTNIGYFTAKEFFISDSATYDANTEYNESDGSTSSSGADGTVTFKATDFAGNTAKDSATVSVYRDTTDPTADATVNTTSVYADVSGSTAGVSWSHSHTVTYDLGGSYDNGVNGGVGIHPDGYKVTNACGYFQGSSTCSISYGSNYVSRGSTSTQTETATVRDWYGNSDQVSAPSVDVTWLGGSNVYATGNTFDPGGCSYSGTPGNGDAFGSYGTNNSTIGVAGTNNAYLSADACTDDYDTRDDYDCVDEETKTATDSDSGTSYVVDDHGNSASATTTVEVDDTYKVCNEWECVSNCKTKDVTVGLP